MKTYLDNIVDGTAGDGKPNFKDVAEAIQPVTLTTYKYDSSTQVAETTTDAKLYLLSTSEASSLPENVLKMGSFGGDATYGQWWLRSPGASMAERRSWTVDTATSTTMGTMSGVRLECAPL